MEFDSPSIQEIEEAINALKNNKAPGTDLIPAELLKDGGTDMAVALHSLIMDIWQTEQMLMEWNKCIICPIYKKGDKLQCKNYRGISLLCTSYKVFTYILNQRLRHLTEKKTT